MAYFQANREIFKLRDPAGELRFHTQSVDRLGSRHEIFQQMFQGVPVWGGQINAHFDREGTLYAVNAAHFPTPNFHSGRTWRLDQKTAVDRAVRDVSAHGPMEAFTSQMQDLLGYAGPIAERNVWLEPEGGAAHWAWRVEIRPNILELWRYFIDATTGEILEKYDVSNTDGVKTASAKDLLGVSHTLNTYQVGSTYYLIDGTRKSFNPRSSLPNDPKGALVTMTAGNTDLVKVSQVTSDNNTWNDAASVSAHYNMAKVYEYYLNTFNRLGIDGAGGTMIAAIHVTSGGQSMDNAYFNGKLMAYGDGGRNFKSTARALDVAGHEMTHGVIAATVNLDYKGQSGSLNESLADVFGVMIDRKNWTLGEDIVNSSLFPTGSIRDFLDPHNGGRSPSDVDWQPSHMVEFVKATMADDNGGVHINSGIPNHACYLIANAIGREKTEQIYYRVLDARYLNPGSQFMDMRLGAVRAAKDLYGENSPEVLAVKQGFTGVGIGSDTSSDIPTPRPPDRAPATGQQYVAYLDAKPGDSSLYMAKAVVTSAADITHLSSTQVFVGSGRPIAVSADGSIILFIDNKHAIRIIDAAGERVVGTAGTWKSVAVSPDGTKAAATTVDQDGKIHILDLANPDQSRAIQLYTPSAGQAGQANNVVYADALEFNSTGESLVYDALNRVPQAQGNPIEFWNANLLEINSGVITPFLPTLPDGVNVGNPSFSKTNDMNVVFDLIDDYSGTFSVMAADLFTGTFRALDSGAVVPGSPRFSTRDDKIVFTKATGTTLNVFEINLAQDKLTPAGKAVSYMANAQKPVWFVKTLRPSGVPGAQASTSWDGFLTEEAGGGFRLALSQPADVNVELFDPNGKFRANLARGRYPAGAHRIGWISGLKSGIYLLRMTMQPETGPIQSITRRIIR